LIKSGFSEIVHSIFLRENIFLKKYENREKICGKERERNIAG